MISAGRGFSARHYNPCGIRVSSPAGNPYYPLSEQFLSKQWFATGHTNINRLKKLRSFHFTKAVTRITILRIMSGKIVIDAERCKGCRLCVEVCPKDNISISKKSNKSGYFPAQAVNSDCTGCCLCAIICPEAAIEVYREDKKRSIKTGGKKNNSPVKEKL